MAEIFGCMRHDGMLLVVGVLGILAIYFMISVIIRREE